MNDPSGFCPAAKETLDCLKMTLQVYCGKQNRRLRRRAKLQWF